MTTPSQGSQKSDPKHSVRPLLHHPHTVVWKQCVSGVTLHRIDGGCVLRYFWMNMALPLRAYCASLHCYILKTNHREFSTITSRSFLSVLFWISRYDEMKVLSKLLFLLILWLSLTAAQEEGDEARIIQPPHFPGMMVRPTPN